MPTTVTLKGSLSSKGQGKYVTFTIFIWHSAGSQSPINTARKDTKFIKIRKTLTKQNTKLLLPLTSCLWQMLHIKKTPRSYIEKSLKIVPKNLSQTIIEFSMLRKQIPSCFPLCQYQQWHFQSKAKKMPLQWQLTCKGKLSKVARRDTPWQSQNKPQWEKRKTVQRNGEAPYVKDSKIKTVVISTLCKGNQQTRANPVKTPTRLSCRNRK